jgi:fibronectin type 3 domain-containing protein
MSFLRTSRVRSLFLTGLSLLLCALFSPAVVHAGEVSLAWDANTEPDIAGYRIHYGLGSRNYDQILDVGNTTTCVVTGLVEGQTYFFAATAVDTAGTESDFSNEVSKTFSISNQPPLANAGPDQNETEGTIVTLSGANSTDPEGGVLTYSWSQVYGTTVTLSNPSAAETTFTPPNVDSNGETLAFQLTVRDSGGLQASDTCLVNVSWVNQPPTANAGTDQSVTEGAVVTLNGSSATDPDGLPLSYEWTQISGTSVTLSDPYDVQPTFMVPSVSQNGETLTFQLTVTDSGGLQARDSCNVNVVQITKAPVAEAGPDQTVNQDATVTLDGTGSTDPNGGLLAFSWLQTSGPPVRLDNPRSAQPRFVADTGGASSSLAFRLTVTDPVGLSASDQCSVAVNAADQVVPSNSVPSVDLTGAWLSVSRSSKKSFAMVSGKIRVQNVGNQAAPGCALYFYQITDAQLKTEFYLGKSNVPSIPAGGYTDVNFNLKSAVDLDCSPVYFMALIDAHNAVIESDKDNNAVYSEGVK